MAEKVQILVEAKDGASGVLRGITSQFGSLGSVIGDLTAKNVSWGNVAASAADLVVSTVQESIKVTQDYAREVRDLSFASGQSAEESSRLIQVLDDYELSAQDAMTATRFLTKNGLAPTVDTIADLADQYNTLNTAQEKNQFILDNLGRGGMKWANVLSQGGDAIRAMNAGVNENLILTEENIRQAEAYRLAVDNMSDSWEGLKISLGADLLGPLAVAVSTVTKNVDESTQSWGAFFSNLIPGVGLYRTLTNGSEAYAESQENAAAAATAAGDAAAASVPDYQKQLSMMQKLYNATQDQIKAVAYQQLQQQLSEGGITPEEAALLEDAGIALGIFDKNAANAARSIDHLNAQLASGVISVQQYVAALKAIPTNINTTLSTTKSVGTGTGSGSTTNIPTANGGEVYAGQPLLVGEAGSEQFIPQQNGRILGHAESLHAMSMGGGSNYFYGNVSLQIDGDMAGGIASYR